MTSLGGRYAPSTTVEYKVTHSENAAVVAVTINADALNWYIRESVFDHLDPEKVVELLSGDEPGGDQL